VLLHQVILQAPCLPFGVSPSRVTLASIVSPSVHQLILDPHLEQATAVTQSQPESPRLLLAGFAGSDHVSPSQVLDEAAIEYEDDDYWDVQSDEEMIDREDGDGENTLVASKEFEIIRRIHFENSSEVGVRRYDAFLYDGLLTRYKPEYAASPLRNPKTARVFAHFIHVVSTGPKLPPVHAYAHECGGSHPAVCVKISLKPQVEPGITSNLS
jgi:hypothetical protein